jgi:hypothetical protein
MYDKLGVHMKNRRDRVFETTIYRTGLDYPETEYFRLIGDLGGISVSDALRQSVFAVHQDTKDYSITTLTGRDLAKAKVNTELNNLVRNVALCVYSDGTDSTTTFISVDMSNYDFLRRLQDPEDRYFKYYREICGDEEFYALIQNTIRNMKRSSPITTSKFTLGSFAAFTKVLQTSGSIEG